MNTDFRSRLGIKKDQKIDNVLRCRKIIDSKCVLHVLVSMKSMQNCSCTSLICLSSSVPILGADLTTSQAVHADGPASSDSPATVPEQRRFSIIQPPSSSDRLPTHAGHFPDHQWRPRSLPIRFLRRSGASGIGRRPTASCPVPAAGRRDPSPPPSVTGESSALSGSSSRHRRSGGRQRSWPLHHSEPIRSRGPARGRLPAATHRGCVAPWCVPVARSAPAAPAAATNQHASAGLRARHCPPRP